MFYTCSYLDHSGATCTVKLHWSLFCIKRLTS